MNKQSEDDREKSSPLDLLLSRRSLPRRTPAQGGGISPLDVLDLPPDLRIAMNRVLRMDRATAAEIAESMHISIIKAAELLGKLAAQGHLRQVEQGGVYEPVLGQSRRPRLSSALWEMLEEE